jgi:hypothetical protein
MTSYEEILESAKRLSSVERLQLADALLAEELGFGMWRAREDIADAEGYVSNLREAEMRTPDGRVKTPEEFLGEIETADEQSGLAQPRQSPGGHRCFHPLLFFRNPNIQIYYSRVTRKELLRSPISDAEHRQISLMLEA